MTYFLCSTNKNAAKRLVNRQHERFIDPTHEKVPHSSLF